MNFKKTLICTALIGLCSLSVQAATWSKTSGGCSSLSGTASAAAMGNSCTIANAAADGSTATVTAWSNTGTLGAWRAAQLTGYSGGFGVNNGDSRDAGEGGDPEHAVDNDFFVDAVRFQFDKSTSLSNVTLGWAPGDGDYSVLAWTGASAVNMGSLSGTSASMSGWTVVGNYSGTNTFSTNVTSSFWLITAYNSAFGSGTNVSNSSNDYFKLLSVTGSTRLPSTRVSEPGALALAGLGLFGAAVVRRRRKQA
jgi:MYXO-CTERM domain-containing protein